MVGFGSSLRLARRAGWEGAYLDYESLKLLLSQIEAVYEEEGHSRMSRENSVRDTLWDDAEILYEQPAGGGRHRRHHHHRPSGGKRPTGHRAAATARDYKDELFLESDSEAAFLSIDEEDYTTTDDDDDDDKQVDNYINKQHATKPFLLSYSHEHPSSSEEGDKKGNDALCWGGGKSGDTAGSNGSKQKSVKKRRKKRATLPSIISEKEEGSFYSVTAGAAANTFYMAGGDDDVAKTPVAANLPTSSNDYNASLQFFPTAESTALLPATRTSSSPSSLFTFTSATGESLTPPSWNMYPRQSKTTNISTFHNHSRAPGGLAESTPILLGDSFTSPRPSLVQPAPLYQQFQNQQRVSANYEKPERRRKRERNVRRVHRQKLRAQRERKVPRHLRLAHAKARAITERFLGLLRAETEKVLLFAQSRLGELADTAGSLRFPSFDEEYASNAYNYSQPPQSDPQPLHGHHHHSNNNNNNTNSDSRAHCGAGTYEFGDGGMHPSASSSSDDGTGGGGLGGGRPWTDSSDEEEDNSNAINGKTANASLQMSGEQTTRSRTQSIRGGLKAASAMMMTMPKSFSGALSDDTPTNVTARTKDMEKLQKVRRQITHFTALRKRRAVFQRNEQILGEDLLFLPAVEETDGYTAVGVELMHVLKYICVNLIAVRKICRKHDRLLMNRMLGGYYQRIRTRGDVQNSYSHNIEGVTTLGGMVARISGDIYEAHPALIGQMNHYKLIGVYDKKIQKLANSRTVQVVSSCLALSLSEYELARSRAAALTRLNSAASFQNSDSQMRFGGDAAAADGESADDPPSTASIISLTRLRYTVMSIFALREVSRSKMDHFMTYLARATLSFTGHPVVGEGFDGCSRETLDFIVSYDPDAALLRDSSLLFDGLKQNRWSHLPLSDVMVSTLAAATSPVNVAPEVASAFLSREERIVAHAVSAVPEWKVFMWKGLINGHFPKMTRRRTVAVTEIPPVALRLNRMSLLLYSVSPVPCTE